MTGRPLRSDALLNQHRVLEAATAAVLREGTRVPMAVIAAEAGVGVATLYRRYPTREALLDALTARSFERVLANARAAELAGSTGLLAIERFLDGAMDMRGELVLPLHGGPAVTTSATEILRTQVHQAVRQMLARGVADGSITSDATARDIIAFGAMLAQPLTGQGSWTATARRLKTIFSAGLAAGTG